MLHDRSLRCLAVAMALSACGGSRSEGDRSGDADASGSSGSSGNGSTDGGVGLSPSGPVTVAYRVAPQGVYAFELSTSRFVNKGVGWQDAKDGALVLWDATLTTRTVLAQGIYARSPALAALAGPNLFFSEHGGSLSVFDTTSLAIHELPGVRILGDASYRSFEADGNALVVESADGSGAFPISRVAADGAIAPIPFSLPALLVYSYAWRVVDGFLYLGVDCVGAQDRTVHGCADSGVYRVPIAGGSPTKVAWLVPPPASNETMSAVAVRGDDVYFSTYRSSTEQPVYAARLGVPGATYLHTVVSSRSLNNAMVATEHGLVICDGAVVFVPREGGVTTTISSGSCRDPQIRDGTLYWIDDKDDKGGLHHAPAP